MRSLFSAGHGIGRKIGRVKGEANKVGPDGQQDLGSTLPVELFSILDHRHPGRLFGDRLRVGQIPSPGSGASSRARGSE